MLISRISLERQGGVCRASVSGKGHHVRMMPKTSPKPSYPPILPSQGTHTASCESHQTNEKGSIRASNCGCDRFIVPTIKPRLKPRRPPSVQFCGIWEGLKAKKDPPKGFFTPRRASLPSFASQSRILLSLSPFFSGFQLLHQHPQSLLAVSTAIV